MIVIIGAGPAGLSAAYHLLKNKIDEFVIVEKDDKIGGLCQSFELGGTILDLGGHAFFTKHEYIKQLLQEIAPEPLYTQPRSAWIYSHETYIPYPFQANLFGLPSAVVEDCLNGLIDVAQQADKSPPKNIEEWIYKSFGSGIAKHFMVPYNQKIWAHPLTDILPNWASDRIVEPDYKEIISGALARKEYTQFPNSMVRYPSKGGYVEIAKYLAKEIPKEKFIKATVKNINLIQKRLDFDNKNFIEFDQVISTIPLTELVYKTSQVPDEIRQSASNLKAFSLYLVNIITPKGDYSTTKQRIYSADPHVPFHKLVLNSNSSDYLRAKETFSYQAEISFSEHKKVNKEGIIDRVVSSLISMGLIQKATPLLETSVIELPLAYPIYTDKWTSSRNLIFSYFEKNNLLCSGRFGEWLYINADDAIMRGKNAADKIKEKLI